MTEAEAGGGDERATWGPGLALAVTLLGLAGFVDAVGFSAFGLFPSFMSGDTTQLGLALTHSQAPEAVVLAGVLVIFVAGAFLGRLVRLGTGRRSPVLAGEAAMLLLAAAAHRFGVEVAALACATLAMGAQATVLAHAGPTAVGATYVTGALARLGSGLADALAGRDRTSWIAYLVLWIALAGGAVAGGLCYGRVGLGSLLPAAGFAAALAAAAWLVEQRRGVR